MSDHVSNIVTNTKELIATTLGATYQELAHVYEVTKNNIRNAKLAYGVRSLSADPVSTVTQTYTLDHLFEIILTDTAPRSGTSDAQLQASFMTMFNKADEIFKAMVNTKISLPLSVLNIFDPRILEPEIIDGETKMAVLRMQVTVKYRSALTG